MSQKLHFGVYLSSVEEACQSGIWNGISQFASDFGISVTTFISTYQQRVGKLRYHYEITMDYAVSTKELDGIIFLGGQVSDGIGTEVTERYISRFTPLSTVIISMNYGDTALLVDNKSGMRQIVDHLIKEHHRRRIAFVRGPKGHREAEERFLAYCEALHDAGISLDEDLICSGQFSEQSGTEAVKTLIDQRHLSFDAIISVDDETAFGVLKELEHRGILVPDDVSVTGFDDVELAEAHAPALTTIRQPFFDLGYSGARHLLERVTTGRSGGITQLKPELVIRQTCGCIPETVSRRYDSHAEGLRQLRDTLTDILSDTGIPRDIARSWFTSLSSLMVQIPEGELRFLREFDRILSRYRRYSSDFSIWQRILSEFQSTVSRLFAGNSDRLIQLGSLILKSSWLIHGALRSEDKKLEIEGDHTQWQIRGIAHNIMTAFDFSQLYSKVEFGFRYLNIPSAVIALYDRPLKGGPEWEAPEEVRIVMAFDRHKRLISDGEQRTILMADILAVENELFGSRTRTSMLMPLFFGEEQLGVMILEENRAMPVDMYEALRLALSTAVKGAALFSEVKDLSIRDELTGLYNRRGFITLAETRIASLARTQEKAELLFIDLDGLKGINDTYGHNEGDWAIRESAKILSQATRKGDILARIGGDEFVLFASKTGEGGVLEIIQRIRRSFAHFNDDLSQKPYRLDCSIGADSTVCSDDLTLDSLLMRADSLLYEEKQAKKTKSY